MGFLSQLIDWIAAIQQFTLVAINKGDVAVTCGGRGEAGIVGEDIHLFIKRTNIDHIRAGRSAEHIKLN